MINVVKGNFDVAYDSYMLSSITGINFRDFEGHILAACTYPNTFVADATMAKVRACLQMVVVAEDLGFKNLVVEGNSCHFTGRSMNHMVHIMVEEGKRWDSPKIWIEEAPPRTESAVEEDRRSLSER